MHKKYGFTLIELIIVVLILGILITLILPQLGDAQNTVKMKTAKTEMEAIRVALNGYKSDYRVFPRNSSSYSTVRDADLELLWTLSVTYWGGTTTSDKKGLADPWGNAEEDTGSYDGMRYDDTNPVYHYMWDDTETPAVLTLRSSGSDMILNTEDDVVLEVY